MSTDLGNVLDVSLLKGFRPKARDGSISAAIAVTITTSGVIESWKVNTNSKDILEVLVPPSTFARIENFRLSFSIKPSEIPWTENSFKSHFINIKDALANGTAAILSTETGDQVGTDGSYNIWMTDCFLYFSLSVDAKGSRLVLQAFYLQDMRENLKADPRQDGDYCPGELLYSIPVEAEFAMTPDYHGPRLTFFTNNVQALRNNIETTPDFVASSCKTLLQKIVRQGFVVEYDKKQSTRIPKSCHGDFPFFEKFTSSRNSSHSSMVPNTLSADQTTDNENLSNLSMKRKLSKYAQRFSSKFVYLLKVLLVVADTVSDLVNGIQLIVMADECADDIGKHHYFEPGPDWCSNLGLAILIVMLSPGAGYGLKEEGSIFHKLISVLFWMFMFPFVIIMKGIGSLLPFLSQDTTTKMKEDFLSMKSYEQVFEAGIQLLINFFCIIFTPSYSSLTTNISIVLSFISVYAGCFMTWLRKSEKGVSLLGHILAFLTLPESFTVAIASFLSRLSAAKFYATLLFGSNYEDSQKVPIQVTLLAIYIMVWLTKLPVLVRLFIRGSKLMNMDQSDELSGWRQAWFTLWKIFTFVTVNINNIWMKIGYITFKVVPNLWLLTVDIASILNFAFYDQENTNLHIICSMVIFFILRVIITITTSFFVIKPSMYVKLEESNIELREVKSNR